MVEYVFREPLTLRNGKDADPNVVGKALEKIMAASGGKLEPPLVWQAAKAPKHPLHRFFEWDVQKAAEAHWSDTARAIIRSVRIVREEGEEPQVAFLSIADKGGTSYRHVNEVLGSADLQLAVLKAAERDLGAWEKRYRELVDICDDVKAAREKIATRRSKLESRAQ